ncbi:ATP-binding cassette domain-containing protein [Streptomyces sp. 4N124]|uniref:ATP-binding cassette domain-containing protein n=1 Tax=Streptomyces sp. 4N124 TaxID=3457420 RepID=UPI003FD26F28
MPETVRAVLPQLRRAPRAVVRLLAWSVLETAQTFLLGYALARALDDGFLRGEPGTGVRWLAGAALAVVFGAFGTARVYAALAGIVEPMRDDLVCRIVHRALRDPDGAAVSRLTHQVEIARDTLAGLLLVSRTFLLTAAAALAGLLALAPVLLLIVVPPLVAGLALFAATLRPLARRQTAFLVADEAVTADLDTALAGLRDIAAAGAQPRVEADAARRIDAELRAARALARWGTLRELAVGIAGRLPVVLLLASAPWLLGHGVTPGALVAALAYLTQSLLPALQSLVLSLGTSAARLAVVLNRLTPEGTEEAVSRLPHANLPPDRGTPGTAASWPAVSLRGLTFAYGSHAEPVLRGLDLDLAPGGHLAVAGPSGIGKSTLTALIAGVLEPDRGEVRLSGVPVGGGRPEASAALRVLVPQEAYVFTGTVRENIAYLCPEPPPDAAVLASCAAVGADGLVARLGGPDGQVDPGSLSAGERQLLALARAHLAPAPLVLLDEATCHLDPAAEARAERAFAGCGRERAGGALVVVAHRISSARRADRILVMDGAHTDCGTHEELLARSALYRDLAGSWAEGSHPALCPADPDGVDAVAGPGLAGDGRHVVAHGPVGQMEVARDLRERGARGGQ